MKIFQPRSVFASLLPLAKLPLTGLVLAAFLFAPSRGVFGAPEPVAAAPLVIGSANFAESELLAELFAQTLEAEGVAVARRFDLGAREVYLEALRRGEIDLVPEYLGSALRYLSGDAAAGDPDAAATQRALRAALTGTGLEALNYAEAENTNVVVVTSALAERYNLATISDLRSVSGELVFGGSEECMTRIACYRGLTDLYGLTFREVKTLDTAGPDTVAALASGAVDVTFLFSTQGVIAEQGFVVLADDRGAQPAENIVPLVRTEIAAQLGARLDDSLSAVTDSLTTRMLQTLNIRMDEGAAPADVARAWLKSSSR